MRNLSIVAACSFILLGAPARVCAEGAQAEVLFAEGRAALEKGDYETACRKFRTSFDASGAIGPLLNLAECEERRGKIGTALGLWKEGAKRLAERKNDDRITIAEQHIADLEKRAPTLTLTLAADTPPGIRVEVKDAPRARVGTPAALDPGTYEVIVSAEGYEERRTNVTLEEGDRRSFEAALGPKRAADAGASEGGGGGRRTAGFVIGGVGLAALAAFGVTGGMMLGKQAVVDEHCIKGTGQCRDAEGLEAARAGQTLGIVNGVMLGVGLAGVGVGTILVITGGSEKKTAAVSAAVLPGGGGLSLSGTF
ncbi:PEGA domain-containing protein [Polyangium aurulentum]|uniref:PEGA domain-containing protein n=1 Tax=Polyangium aurulentum TaxID=2567896 RepID=UPI00146E3D7F|nr:PEGA domain-containing protein [Polyangium aurulentum]UQA57628.1 PEGA domain-containing protein [Polyangium aurulentum]